MALSPPLNPRAERCLEQCESCHAECLETAMHECLEMGGRHVEPAHFRLMMSCAQLCQTTADFMLSHSPYHVDLCALCAEVCDACAQSCQAVGGLQDCAEVCRSCAESCRQVVEFERPGQPIGRAARASEPTRPMSGNA
jgi:hypothetical protein